MISEDDKKVFAWLDELCQEAQKDVMLANRLGNNPAFAYYFANVYTLKALTPATFASMQVMKEARRWYNEDMEAEAHKIAEAARDAEIAELKSGLAEALAMLKTLTESKGEPKRGKGKQAAAEEATEEEAE